MTRSRKYLLYIGAVVWAIAVTGAVLFAFFPYQKAFKLVFQDIAVSGRARISFVGAGTGFGKASASKIMVAHEGVEGKPFYEMEKVELVWNPLTLLKGSIRVSSHAFAYGGKVNIDVAGLPVFGNGTPVLNIRFAGVDLAKYPENTLPWFKVIRGAMNGMITKDVRFVDRGMEKGTFTLRIKDGELRGIAFKEDPKASLPFKEVLIEGRIKGGRWEAENVSIKGNAYVIRGAGVIQDAGDGAEINARLSYESSSQDGILAGKGTITISGNLWAPEISMAKEAGPRTVAEFEKSLFYQKYKVKSKRSAPLKSGGTGFSYIYRDEEDKGSEVELLLSPDPQKIESVSILWRSRPPAQPPRFTEAKEEFLKNLLLSFDAAMDTAGVVAFVQNQQDRRYPGGEDAMTREKIEKLTLHAGVTGQTLIVGISFLP